MQEHALTKEQTQEMEPHGEECKETFCTCCRGRSSTVETDLSCGFDFEPMAQASKEELLASAHLRMFTEEDFRHLLADPDLFTAETHEVQEPKREKLEMPGCLTGKNLSLQVPLRSPSVFPISSMSSRSSKLLTRRGKNLAEVSISSLSLPTLSPARNFFQRYSINKKNFRGCGSSASVYGIEDSESTSTPAGQDKRVVKVYTTSDEATLQAAQNEVSILQKLPFHDNIVRYCEHYEQESPKQFCIVLQDAGDVSLDSFVRQEGELEYETVRSLAKQLLSAVNHLHKHEVCHRDIKPDNILITGKSESELVLRLIDFNVAHDLSKSRPIYGKTGVDAWSAPETRKWKSYDEKSDMWSVGCILLFLLTGQSDKQTGLEILSESDYQNRPDCHLLVDLLEGLLDSDPNSRISSAKAAAHAWVQ
jgi:Protein kinase domain